jgi:Leucine-rich repeat (LRR) protein
MIALLHSLNQDPDPSMAFPKFGTLLSETRKFKKLIKRTIEKGNYVPFLITQGELFSIFEHIIHQCEADFSKDCRIKEAQPGSAPVSQAEEPGVEFVQIQSIPFSTLRKNVDLSVLKMDDHLLVAYLPALEKMKNLTELQLRCNKLTKRGYTMLFNALPNLESLDVSCSNSEALFEILSQKLPSIKALYLNETALNDQRLLAITANLHDLKVLFADLNQISSEGVTEFFKTKKKIIFASMKNNQISKECGTSILLDLISNGGYLEY